MLPKAPPTKILPSACSTIDQTSPFASGLKAACARSWCGCFSTATGFTSCDIGSRQIDPLTVLASLDFNGAQKINLHFNGDISSTLGFGDVLLNDFVINGFHSPLGISVSQSVTQGMTDATVTLPLLPNDGNYQLILRAGSVADAAGNALAQDFVYNFFILAGDANFDRKVNALDFNVLASHFGMSGVGVAGGDFDFNGVVNTSDFNKLAGRFNKTLAPLAAPLTEAIATPVPSNSVRASLFSAKFVESRILTGFDDFLR